MLIGIDCSRAFGSFWGGPESYSYFLIQAILKAGSKHQFRLYLPPNAKDNPRYKSFFSGFDTSNISPSVIPDRDPGSRPGFRVTCPQMLRIRRCRREPGMTGRYELKTINWKRLWTQGGLALECLLNPPDVLFVPAHTLPILRRPGLKTVVTIHDLGAQYLPNYHKFPQKHYLNVMTQYAVKNATKIIAVSEYTKKDIIQKFQISKSSRSRHPDPAQPEKDLNSRDSSGRTPPWPTGTGRQNDGGWGEKIHVVYEGYDRGTFYPRSQEEIDSVKSKLRIEGEYFLFVGTIQPRKNLVRLIEAFSHLVSKRPPVIPGRDSESRIQEPGSQIKSGMTLVLAGASGWLNEEIYDAPKKFGVEDKVKFVGQVTHEDLPALMSGAAAFVFPSLFEGFGLAPLEAMACGVPVILSNVTSLPEVGGQAALYVDPSSASDIASKMELVLSMSDPYRDLIVKKGLDQVQKFSWEQAAVETLMVLESA